ncbi:hypothetical protein NDA15_004925 [Ustilago hordei]|nr:hypothetical protein NDA15_004925 [Ustilago hordei]
MDSYGFTCKGALSPYARRTRHSHEEDQAQRAGAAMRRTKLRWLPLRGSRDRKSTQVMRRRSSVEGVDTGHEEEEQCRRITEYLKTIAVAQFDSRRVSRQTDLGFRRETPDKESDSNNDNKWYDYCTLAKIVEAVPKLMLQNYYSWSTLIKATLRVVPHATQHLEGTYDSDHPKWNRTFDNTLAGVLHSTLDTEGEYNTHYLLLDISKTYLTFHQTWKKIKKGLTSEATRTLQ